MKKRNKQAVCYNCNRPLTQSDNFCPNCGQENSPHKIGMAVLLGDFFNNYFSFDSKLSRSTFPFLFKPGYLTNRFNEGKRSTYVHPLRLYFIITFVFFFLLSLLIDKVVVENKLSVNVADNTDVFKVKVPAQAEPELQQAYDSLKANAIHPNATQTDSPDSLAFNSPAEKWGSYMGILKNQSYSDDEVLDTLSLDKHSDLHRLFVHQFRRVLMKDVDIFLPYLIKNLSIMMFLLLPAFAFYIYILFRRTDRYYISHAIHALHLHSFSFFILCMALLLVLFTDGEQFSHDYVMLISFLLITLYAFISVKRVYKQSWIKTFFKFNVLGFCYFFTLCVSISLEIIISFLLF